ncbi:tumor necrosis factor ligand superfamily member 6-like [Gastrophryne carolinensis]
MQGCVTSPGAVFTVEEPGQCPPAARRRRPLEATLLIQVVLMLFAVLAVCGAAAQVYYVRRVEAKLEEALKKVEMEAEAQKMTQQPGKTTNKPSMKKIPSLAVKDASSFAPLLWEPTRGHSFLHEVEYVGGSLRCPKSGLYFVYSKLQLGTSECPTKSNSQFFFTHWVNRRASNSIIPLMDDRKAFCDAQKSFVWKGSSFLASSFLMEKGDEIFVNVSHKELVRPQEDGTYFGIFKL